MTLRARLVISVVVAFLIVVLTFVSVIKLQQSYVERQIDNRLERLGQIAEIVVAEYEGTNNASKRVLEALWDGYIGVFDGEGVLTTIVAPRSDRNLVPSVDFYSASVSPVTGPTLSGISKRVRSKTVPLSDGRVALVGLSTTDGDNAVGGLKITLVLAGVLVGTLLLLLSWWSYRLGFRPIAQMVRDADAYSSGELKRRLIVTRRGSETMALAASLNRLIDSAASSEEKIRHFVADASHELRTPLTTLQGYSSLYLSGGIMSSDETHDAMERIHAESVRMTRMVNDLLQMIESRSTTKLQFQNIDVAQLIDGVVSDLRALDGHREITSDPGKGLWLLADRERCTQVLLALGTNALIHSGDLVPVSVTATRTSSGIRFEVGDSGRGIAEEHLPYVFDRLYKVDASRMGGKNGSGLGLAIVAEIMRACGGSYGVESTMGVGTTFWVEFPSFEPAQ